MQGSFRRVFTGAIFFVITSIVAVFGYTVAGWTLLDAVYMVVITIFGVGYGEVKPIDSPALKIFTILVIIAGTSSAVYAVGGFVQMVTEGEVNRALGVRRMTHSIKSLQQHVIICGFGRIGQLLARKMAEAKRPFVIIDNSTERMAEAEAMGYLVRSGNATDEGMLKSAGIERAKVLATVLPEDADNVFISLTARELNPSLIIIARGEFPSTEKKLRLAGADHVVLPAAISAVRMAHMITHPAALDFLDQTDGRRNLNEQLAQIDVQIDELAILAGSPLVGKTIGDIEVRGKGTFIIVALRRADGTTITHPDQSIILAEDDAVIVMGHRGDIPQFAQHYALKRQLKTYRGSRL